MGTGLAEDLTSMSMRGFQDIAEPYKQGYERTGFWLVVFFRNRLGMSQYDVFFMFRDGPCSAQRL